MPSSEQMRVGLEAEALAHARGQGEAPGGVHAPAVGREDAQPPVADLVAEALEHDRALARAARAWRPAARAGRRAGCARRARRGRSRAASVSGVLLDGPARERADRLAELDRAPDGVALPERHRAGGAGGGRDDHAVAADLLDPPGGGAEQERLPGPRLVDHLLVELADAPPVGQRRPRRGRGRGSCRRWRSRAGASPCARGSCPRRGPRRCARAARRTPWRDSARRACRARSRAARARGSSRSTCW